MTHTLLSCLAGVLALTASAGETIFDFSKGKTFFNPSVPEQDNSDIERLEAAIARLPELYREAIVLGVLSGMDGRSTAEQLGCSPNTLYQRIHKAKQLLRHKYREVQDE